MNRRCVGRGTLLALPRTLSPAPSGGETQWVSMKICEFKVRMVIVRVVLAGLRLGTPKCRFFLRSVALVLFFERPKDVFLKNRVSRQLTQQDSYFPGMDIKLGRLSSRNVRKKSTVSGLCDQRVSQIGEQTFLPNSCRNISLKQTWMKRCNTKRRKCRGGRDRDSERNAGKIDRDTSRATSTISRGTESLRHTTGGVPHPSFDGLERQLPPTRRAQERKLPRGRKLTCIPRHCVLLRLSPRRFARDWMCLVWLGVSPGIDPGLNLRSVGITRKSENAPSRQDGTLITPGHGSTFYNTVLKSS